YDKHDDAAAIKILAAFIRTTSNLAELVDAYSLLSDAFTRRGEYQRAVMQLEHLLSLLPPIDTLGIHTTLQVTTKWLQRIARLHTQQGDLVSAVDTMLREHALAKAEDQERLVAQIETMLQTQLTRDDLHAVADRYPTMFPGDAALSHLIQRYDHAGNNEFFSMEQLVNRLVEQFPEQKSAQVAVTRLNTLRVQLQAHRYIIGVALPMSGPLAPYAKDILTGIRLAINQQQMTDSLGIVTIDVAQQDRTLIDQVTQLQADFNPIALLGPLLSKNLNALAEWAEYYGIPVVSPTATQPAVARHGSFLFSTATTGTLLGNAIAQYAMFDLGMTQFAILAPDDPYGAELSTVFATAIAQIEGIVLATVFYDPGETDFKPYIQIIRDNDLKHDGILLPPLEGEEGEEEDESYFPGLDAIFLPDGHKTVGLIAAHLHYHDMNVTLLGANGWNNSDLIRYGEQAVEGGVFVDTFNLHSPNTAMQAFVRDYQASYQSDPSEFSALAYDTTQMVLHTIHQGAMTGRAVGASLRALHQFPSLSGPATMTPAGTLNRSLVVITVDQGAFVQLN
ncbi:MAG: hypothetical protein CMH81_00325, partial [Nitrospiraceae bacterium]|nr:hypothetical protein [Nitrospiraceae bacterium]